MDPKSQANATSESRSVREKLDGLCSHDHDYDSHKSRHHNNSHEENISIPSNSKHAEQAIAPFLAKHIPTQYNPVGHLVPQSNTDSNHDHHHHQDASSTKFCYRHRPDLKCRRQANEPSMEQLQNVSDCFLSNNDSPYADLSIGTRYRLSIRPASHLPRLVSLLRRPLQTSQSHAPGHPIAMLLSPTLLHLRFRSRLNQDRFSFCPTARARLQNPLLPRHYFVVQGRSSQSTLEKPCRR